MLRTVVAIRHIGFEDLGFFDAPLREAGYKIHYYDAGKDDLWTIDPVRTSLIVILGGPMGAYEEEQYPFLRQELQIVKDRIACNKPILGICLGAQLIARALGVKVYPGSVKEIGLSPISLTIEGLLSPLAAVAPDQPVLHWHGDTFDLPADATLLASTATYPHQAFSCGRNLLALQFHLEAGTGIERWIEGHSGELRAAGVNRDDLLEQTVAAAPALERVAAEVLGRWLAGLKA